VRSGTGTLSAERSSSAVSSLAGDELLSEQSTATWDKFIGDLDNELALIEEREALRPLLAQLAPDDH
jgi:hypothetical protein